MKSSTGRSPCPGKLRKCRDHCSRSMSIRGASASCTKVIRSAGIDADRVARQPPRQHVPAVEDHARPTDGRPAARSPRRRDSRETCRPQASASKPTSTPKPCGDLPELAQVRRRPVDPAEARRRDVGADEDAPRAELAHQRELPPRPLEARGSRCGSGMPSKSRNGWKATISSPWSRTIRPISAGEPSLRQDVGLEDLHPLEAGARRSPPASRAACRQARPSRSRTSWPASPRLLKQAAPDGRRPSFC